MEKKRQGARYESQAKFLPPPQFVLIWSVIFSKGLSTSPHIVKQARARSAVGCILDGGGGYFQQFLTAKCPQQPTRRRQSLPKCAQTRLNRSHTQMYKNIDTRSEIRLCSPLFQGACRPKNGLVQFYTVFAFPNQSEFDWKFQAKNSVETMLIMTRELLNAHISHYYCWVLPVGSFAILGNLECM